MILTQLFPQGKRYAVTLSYDDGVAQDKRLLEIMNRNGLKGTFHLNDSRFGRPGRVSAEEVAELYKGHEVSCHTVNHYMPTQLTPAALSLEVLENRRVLERLVGYPVMGMSYPFGNYNEAVMDILTACGVVYSRTTVSTHKFSLPADFRAWHPTCRHSECLPDVERFLKLIEADRKWEGLAVFCLWGHSYEFDNDNNWDLIEDVAARLGGREEIWYATNIEIYNYVTALRSLQSDVDGKMLYNPSAVDIWVMADEQPICIPAGKQVNL